MSREEIYKRLKERLERERRRVLKELEKVARRDKESVAKWDALFPDWEKDSGDAYLEIATDEVEEYSNILPAERLLANYLSSINLALEKMKEGKYGICEKCGKEISLKRLMAFPAARLCKECKDKYAF